MHGQHSYLLVGAAQFFITGLPHSEWEETDHPRRRNAAPRSRCLNREISFRRSPDYDGSFISLYHSTCPYIRSSNVGFISVCTVLKFGETAKLLSLPVRSVKPVRLRNRRVLPGLMIYHLGLHMG